MNIRQKVALGIIAPLFSIAVGTTILHKVNRDKTQQYIEAQNRLSELYEKKHIKIYEDYQSAIANYKKGIISAQEFKNIADSLENEKRKLVTGEP